MPCHSNNNNKCVFVIPFFFSLCLLKDDRDTQQICYILQLPESQFLDNGIREKPCDSFYPYICRRIGSKWNTNQVFCCLSGIVYLVIAVLLVFSALRLVSLALVFLFLLFLLVLSAQWFLYITCRAIFLDPVLVPCNICCLLALQLTYVLFL